MEISKNFITNFSTWCKECKQTLYPGGLSTLDSNGNYIQFDKKGNKIHIKKQNRGKFTDYCGGKVTSECIAKGKNSPNPAIRKRATFAANARKWKHKKGGVIRYTEDGRRVPDKCPKCGADIVVQLHGEPVYICKNKHYFGTVKFNK